VINSLYGVAEPRPPEYQPETFDLDTLRESYDTEFKKALGRDGRGKVPEDFWESYSAMANTEGGYIFLGIEERKEELVAHSLDNPSRMIKELWDTLNNPTKVSQNILQRANIREFSYEGKTLIQVRVPQATRKQRPVYIGTNPLSGTFFRRHEGDYVCNPDQVKMMLGEQVNDTRDSVILERYSYEDDIDKESLRIFRQIFLVRKPDHPFHVSEDKEFLRQLGGLGIDRVSGEEYLTLAGLLMFGKFRSILDAIPNYLIDYQERLDDGIRWTDRVTTDGTWSGNLFDFYRIVIRKLTAEVKIPFKLQGDIRVEETPVHEALREALVNTIIHADYSGTGSILVMKRPYQFEFKNPGLMRVSQEEALCGGVSDCRNRNMQKMFQLIGLGEQAGSGFLKIYRNWAQEYWRQPELYEEFDKNQTYFILKMVSLYPEPVLAELRKKMGEAFDCASPLERVALIIAESEGCVTHSRLKKEVSSHPHDITLALQNLVKSGYLHREGHGRMTFYYQPGRHPIHFDHMEGSGSEGVSFDPGVNPCSTDGSSVRLDGMEEVHDVSSDPFNGSLVHLTGSLVHLDESPVHLHGSLVHVMDDPDILAELREIAKPVSSTGKASRELVEDTIIQLCKGRFLTIDEIAYVLDRNKDSLRKRYIGQMIEDGRLMPRYMNVPSHPKQGYIAVSGGEGLNGS